MIDPRSQLGAVSRELIPGPDAQAVPQEAEFASTSSERSGQGREGPAFESTFGVCNVRSDPGSSTRRGVAPGTNPDGSIRDIDEAEMPFPKNYNRCKCRSWPTK